MMEPEDYIHLIAQTSNALFNRHVKLQATKSLETSTYAEKAGQATRTLAALNALRMALNEYEQDMLIPVLRSAEPMEQLL